ncbi:unnamed protein product, partial [Closterium sp. NIES-64]
AGSRGVTEARRGRKEAGSRGVTEARRGRKEAGSRGVTEARRGEEGGGLPQFACCYVADRVRAPVMSASHKIIEAPFGLPGKRGHELWQSYVACHPEGMARFQQILAEAGHSVQDLHVHIAVALPSTPERECHYARANPSFHGMPAFSHAAMLGNTRYRWKSDPCAMVCEGAAVVSLEGGAIQRWGEWLGICAIL